MSDSIGANVRKALGDKEGCMLETDGTFVGILVGDGVVGDSEGTRFEGKAVEGLQEGFEEGFNVGHSDGFLVDIVGIVLGDEVGG